MFKIKIDTDLINMMNQNQEAVQGHMNLYSMPSSSLRSVEENEPASLSMLLNAVQEQQDPMCRYD